jgi:hypothetical protein
LKFGEGNKGRVSDAPRFTYSTARIQSLGWRPRLDLLGAICRSIVRLQRKRRPYEAGSHVAAGKSPRRREVLGEVPTPLAEVCGDALLGSQCACYERHGFSDVLVRVNFGAQALSNWLSRRPDAGLVVTADRGRRAEGHGRRSSFGIRFEHVGDAVEDHPSHHVVDLI